MIYCTDFKSNHSQAISGDGWPDDMRLSDLEPRFVCSVCGKRGADVRPDFIGIGQMVGSRASAITRGHVFGEH